MSASESLNRSHAPHNLSTSQWMLVALVLSMHVPLAVLHAVQLWKLPHYQCFPLVLAGAVWLAWQRRPQLRLAVHTSRRLPLALLLCSAGVQLLAIAMYSPWLAAVGALVSLAALSIMILDRSSLRTLLPVWLFLWWLIPLPFGRDRLFVEELQALTARLAGAAVDALGIQHLLSGNVLELPARQLFVDEACSGANTVFAFVALVAAFTISSRRPWIIALPLLAAAIVWAALANVVRMVSIVLALEYFAVDLTEGWPHTLLSLSLLPLTLLLLSGTDVLLMLLFGPIRSPGVLPRIALKWNRWLGWNDSDFSRNTDSSEFEETTPSHAAALPRTRLPRSMIAVAVLGLMLCLLQISLLVQGVSQTVLNDQSVALLVEQSLPEEYSGWTRWEFEHQQRETGHSFGEHSVVWKYGLPERGNVSISFDYPFVDWHELTHCYASTGWNVLRRTAVESIESGQPVAMVLAELEKPTGEYAMVVFGLFDREGNSITPPDTFLSQLKQRVSSVLTRYRVRSETYQLQLFAELPRPSGDEIERDLCERFVQLRRTVLASGSQTR